MKFLAVALLSLATTLNAATIAVIDSGVDYGHSHLRANMWRNSLNQYGWNFVDNNSKIFDPLLLFSFSPDMQKYADIVAKNYVQQASESEIEWAKSKSKEKGFSEEFSRYGTYVHGTHVAGIAMDKTKHEIMGVLYLRTPVKQTIASALEEKSTVPLVLADKDATLTYMLFQLATSNAIRFKQVLDYLKANKIQIANASLGSGYAQARNVAERVFETIYKRRPTELEVTRTALKFLNLLTSTSKNTMAAASDTLLVFAAGNEGLSNDLIGTWPSNVKVNNTISVAATYKDIMLAPFSNFGEATVDIAAPGVNIVSSVPGNKFLPFSGTSQAAPSVARVAGRIKDANKSLTPLQIKTILMKTVDKKPFLEGKVASGGVMNADRAVYAAGLSLMIGLDEAIERANLTIRPKSMNKRLDDIDVMPKDVVPMPLPSPFED